MKAELDCLDCIARQALRAARIATSEIAVQRRIVDDTCRRLPGMDLADSPAALSMAAYQLASQHAGRDDPYAAIRREQNERALALEPELRTLVAESPDPLDAALHIAAAGNVIDLGTQQAEQIDVRAALEQVMHERFAVDHTAAFKRALADCTDLVFLLDNAGEIVFDKILIETLLPHTRVTAVVKGAPIINDAIRADAEQVGLTSVCEVIDNGGAFIGSPLDRVPSWFLDRLHHAGMVVGKGQGNYETVDGLGNDTFLILRAKCEVVARHMGIRYGQVGLISTRQRAAEKGTPQTS